MRLTKHEKDELEVLITSLDDFMEEVWKKKRNKKLYVALGQSRMALEAAKGGGIIQKFLIAKAW